ncbi:MAG: endonuclease Q family protein, partial [Chitinispirillaceae bacterium]|nr:endonuclease Q family protein [Chitinispirillaceae bacterium]
MCRDKMEIVADFHIHSHYSRATSADCCPEKLDIWARRKGINLLGTGDFTHAGWRKELKEKLIRRGDGFYELKDELREKDIFDSLHIRFVVTGEISSIYKKNGRTRKIHNLIILPSIEDAEKLSLKLEKIGNLHSDGRPIIGLDSKSLLEMTLEISPMALFIPAHIWTPHFSLFGANSGFDDIEECFEDLTKYIYSLETGLSSDPAMNWRLSKLDRFALTSNSDAHSPANIAREANVFNT